MKSVIPILFLAVYLVVSMGPNAYAETNQFDASGFSAADFSTVPFHSIPEAKKRIQERIEQIDFQLDTLPQLNEPLQLDAYGYHGGYLPALDELPEEPRWTVKIQFEEPYMKVNPIILVPAIDRSVTPIRSYGFPKRFRVLREFPDGSTKLTHEWMEKDCPDPGRTPLILDGIGRISSKIIIEVYRGDRVGEKEVFALDEILGVRKHFTPQAESVEVSSELESLPYWGAAYLIDRKTSLGLPLGYQAEAENVATDYSIVLDQQPSAESYIEIEITESSPVNEIILYPAVPSDGVLIPGYGFPGKVRVERQISNADGERRGVYANPDQWNEGNPGHNIVRIPIHKHGRWFRLYVCDLPVVDGKPVFALGEILVQRNEFVYPIQKIELHGFPESAQKQTHLLIDQKANGQPVMLMQDWLDQLTERSRLEQELHDCLTAEDRLGERWNRTWRKMAWSTVIFILVLALSGFGFSLIQRYRLRRRVEEEHRQMELEQMKVRFFTHISHELRTPLTVILGPLEKLMKMLSEPLQLEYASLMHRNVKKLQKLVDQLLEFRTLQEQNRDLSLSSADLVRFVRNSFQIYHSMATDKSIHYRLSIPDEPVHALVDAGKFQKILDNLISNALKYTPESGSVHLLFKVDEIDGIRASLQFIVEDTGVGITEADLPHVFEQFYRADGLQPIQAVGSGIGLALVKELVDVWGGEIAVESPINEGHGTRFTVRLPVEFAEAEDVEPEEILPPEETALSNAEDSVSDRMHPSGPRILIVEDNEEVRLFIRLELAENYEVYEGVDGEDGLKKVMEIMPDLIVTDVMMPKMDGVEFCRRIKQDEITSHIPVIMLTARGSQEHQLEGLETGADDYVTKPFSSPLLKARIHNLLESRRLLRERFSRGISVEPSAITVTSADEKFLQRAIGVVEEHMEDPEFSVQSFSKAMHMDRSTLLVKLKALVDQSPQAFIRILRLKRAKQLLEQGSDPVADIAFQVGFHEPTNFSRAFKKQFDRSPTECRKNGTSGSE
ncbi:hybrid sensor histidine kinase/response regulator transcription factor [Pontiella sulfatireligans]|uniref:histidine kinase n=1 Tax=Pontiella sulfatireligans TaxID=2750658 RepID=A0A6C2UFC8_9BACT|nr:response regulator [Pontiella sulfatireligans]VGO18880.1 Sensor histidine kinase TmoS [Pontiella sulfatireligans]